MPNYSFLEMEIAGIATTVCHALEGREVVGTASVQHRGLNVAQIVRVFVAEKFRGQDIGTTLVQQCCAYACDSGCEAVALTVEANNRAAIPFYKKLGFKLAFQWADGDQAYSRQP